ncbi:MAG: HAD family phosphatase [Anaerolineae bacterium]|nr:HAD family phosphatase [Anaerolineae bacterium]
MIEAVVFDMDGLLVDSEPLWQQARIAAFGAERLRWTDADQREVMGSSTQAWARQIQTKLDDGTPTEEIIERVLDELVALYRREVPLMPGANEILTLLRGRYPLGLASGSPYRLIHAALESAGWDGIFDPMLSTDDMPRGKPAPDIYLAITARMGVPVERTAVIEDSTNGILSGVAAGVKVIAVPARDHPASDDVLSQASLVLSSLHDFSLDMLRDL